MTSFTEERKLTSSIMEKINKTAVGILYAGWFSHLDTIQTSTEPCTICDMYIEAIEELGNDLPK